MNINVTRTEVIVGNGYIVNKGEYKINPCIFTFSQEYTNLVKKAVFDDGKTTKEMAIINNRCELPYEVLDSDSFQLRVYAYRVNEQELELVYSPTPAIIYLREGSYRGVTGSGEIITPTQYEQYEQALNDGLDDLEAGLQEVSNVDIDVSKSGNTATVTITDRQGTEKSVEIFDGDDYVLTEEDKQEIINTVEAEVSLDIPTKVSQLENDSAYINKEVNNLTNYTLKTNTGSSIELSINSSTYVMTLNLKNSAGTTISTGTIDLPLETMVVGATYDNTNKKIVLTLKNGSTIDVPVADLVSGLQSEINSNNKLSSDLVDDTNHTNKFVTASEKEQITTNATDISNIKDGTSIDSFGDVETALSGKEDSSNKVTSIDENSTDTQYPSAKTVYDNFVTRDEEIEKLQTENAQLLADHPDILDENNEFPSGTDLILNGTGDLEMSVDVGGNSTQIQYEGYNLLPNTAISQTTHGVTVTVNDDKSITLNGTSDFNIEIAIGTVTLPAGTYRFSGLTGSTADYAYINFQGITNVFSDEVNYTLSEEKTTNARLLLFNGKTYNNLTIYPMIIKGSTSKPYEPYVGNEPSPNPTYKQDINNVEGNVVAKGKNRQLFDKDNANILNGYFTPSDTTFVTNNAHRSVYIPCKSDTIYTVQKIATSRFRVGFTDILPANGVTITNSMPSSTNGENLTEVTVTSGANSKYLIAWVSNTNATSEPYMNDILNSLQIVEGSTAKPYTAYAENTVTFPLSQGQKLMLGDTLEDDGIHHKREQITLNGTENWIKYSDNEYYVAQGKGILDNSKAGTSYIYGFCNKVTTNNNGQLLFNIIKKTTNTGGIDIQQLSSYWGFTGNNVTDFKSWLSQNPIILEYELETETTETYTQAQQTAYNKLKEMQSYYDLTYVVGSSDNAQPILTVQAKKSLKVINDEISNLNSRLTLLEE